MKNLPLEVYASAIERVPAYRRFLEEHCGAVPDIKDMDDFSKLPFMDKPGYVRVYPLADRCLDGSLKGTHMIAHSSGSSGKHLYWPVLRDIEKDYWRHIHEEFKQKFNIETKSTLVVLGLLMGGNLSGALFAYALRAIGIETGDITLVTPGRNEEECIEVISEFSPSFEQTILFSYGATAKNIIEELSSRGAPVKNFNLKLRLIGEGYSESFRDRINELLGYPYGYMTSISSGYGATDFRAVGKETLLCVAIKRLLHEKNMLGKVLDMDTMPTICQYSPSDVYIEEDEGELVMTRHNATPLVRYRVGDAGFVIGYNNMMLKLNDHGLDPFTLMRERGHDPDMMTRNPFVVVSGRKDGLTFFGTKIFVSKIKAIIEETPYLTDRLTGEFQMRKVENENGDPRLEIAVVAREGIPDLSADHISNVIAEGLKERQGGIYAALLARDLAAALPNIIFVKRDEIMTPSSFKIRWLA